MSESKKYYWLKLKSDFFVDDTIKFIEEHENGIKYSNFYLKLCLKSLKTDGKLIRLVGETLIPYDINSLSKLTGVEFDTVRSAMQLFESIGLIKVLESGEIYLSQIDELIGSETDKAQMMRRLRAERKLDSNNVTQMLPEKEKEIEIEKEIDNNIYEKPQSKKPEVENQGQLNTNKQNTKKEDIPSSKDEELRNHFELIWNIYPNKKGKAKALQLYFNWLKGRKINSITSKLTDEQMYYAVLAYKKECEDNKIDIQFIKHGDTFFNTAILDYVE